VTVIVFAVVTGGTVTVAVTVVVVGFGFSVVGTTETGGVVVDTPDGKSLGETKVLTPITPSASITTPNSAHQKMCFRFIFTSIVERIGYVQYTHSPYLIKDFVCYLATEVVKTILAIIKR